MAKKGSDWDTKEYRERLAAANASFVRDRDGEVLLLI